MIKGIVFDKDGTLMDYEGFWVPVAEGAIKLLLDSVGKGDKLSSALDAIGAYDGIHGVLCHGTYGDIAGALNDALLGVNFSAEMVADAFERSSGLARIMPTCDNIRDVFEKLSSRGLILAVVTSDNDTMTKQCLSALGILDLFDVIYTDDGVHPSKPAPYYMERFCSEYKLSASEVLMVGDTMTDMNFAKNSGTLGVGVGKYAEELLSGKADHIIPDISHIFEVINKHKEGVK